MTKIDDILNDFQKKFGIKQKAPDNLETISTGYDELDHALGINGIPKGKITEISGEAGAGKTLLAYNIIASAQKKNLFPLYIDTEGSFSKIYAKKFGVDIEKLLICAPVCGEIALQIIRYYVENNLVDLIVLDSLPALISQDELENNLASYQDQGTMIGSLLKQTIAMIEEKKLTMICINQIRYDLKNKKYTVPFDKYMCYYAPIRIGLSRQKSITKWRKILGYKIEADIYKNNYFGIGKANYNLMLGGK